MFLSVPYITDLELDHASAESEADVRLYIKTQLDTFCAGSIVPEQMREEVIQVLSKGAKGLFIWAATVSKMIEDELNPLVALKAIISSPSVLAEPGLDELYATVLNRSGIKWTNPRSRDRFSRVLGLILLSKIPFTPKEIDTILGFPGDESCEAEELCGLRSVLSYSPNKPVTLFHASFSDYLLSPDRKTDPWFIDIPLVHQFLAMRCFEIMKGPSGLCFDMCNFPSSFMCNDEVPGLDERVKDRISSCLAYACRFWSEHLCGASPAPGLLQELSDFAYTRLLYWFEALSLLKSFSRANPALLSASQWAVVSPASQYGPIKLTGSARTYQRVCQRSWRRQVRLRSSMLLQSRRACRMSISRRYLSALQTRLSQPTT